MEIIATLVDALWFALPIYVANAAPVLPWYLIADKSGKKWRIRNVKRTNKSDFILNLIVYAHKPINKRLFGEHRSVFNTALVIITAFFTTIAQGREPLVGAVLGVGAVFGICLNSYIKRRLGIREGGPFPVMDQLDFVIGAQLAYYAAFNSMFPNWLVIFAMTLVLHPMTCIIAHLLGLKEEWL